MRGEYHAAISSATALLGETLAPGEPATVLNATQRLRLHLLRCDCYSGLRSHQRGLEEAKIAIEQSNALSPQAFFVAARESYRLGKVKEALENFENAETLIATGVGIAELAPADSTAVLSDAAANNNHNADDDAWASIGVCPRDVRRDHVEDGRATASPGPSLTTKVPLTPSYEWAQELELWRQYHAEAKIVHQMTRTHLVPSRLASQAVQYVCKDQVFTSSNSRTSQVIVIRNTMTKSHMRLAYTTLSDCAVVEPYAFPQVIQPGEVGIAVVAGTSWAGGSKGLVVYTIEMSTVSVGFLFEAPMVSDYAAGCWLRTGKGSSDRSNAPDVKLKPRPTCTEEIIFKDTRCKALVSNISRVVTFVLTEVQPFMLSTTELVGVLEFLPPQALRKCTAASWHVRDAIGHLPPQMFWTAPSSASSSSYNGGSLVGSGASTSWFPNYLFASDYVVNPWIIRGTSDITWKIAFDGLQRELEEYCALDAFDCRVLTVALDLQCKGLAATVYYGGGKRRQQVSKVSEGWSMFSRPPSSWKLNNGRKIGSVSITNQEVTFLRDAAEGGGPEEPILVMRRGPKTSPGKSKPVAASPPAHRSPPTLVISRMPSNDVVAEVYFRSVVLNTTGKGDYVADVVMKPGCDAFLTSVLATYGRTKWAVLP